MSRPGLLPSFRCASHSGAALLASADALGRVPSKPSGLTSNPVLSTYCVATPNRSPCNDFRFPAEEEGAPIRPSCEDILDARKRAIILGQ